MGARLHYQHMRVRHLSGVHAHWHVVCTLALQAAPCRAMREHFVVGAERPLGAATAGRAALLIGPEGGFEPEEVAAVAARGFAPCSLGPLTLRVETAALVGLARLCAPGPAAR